MTDPKKISRRGPAVTKPSGRLPSPSGRTKKPSGRQEPQEEPQEEEIVSDEPLFEDGDVPMAKIKNPVKVDEHLISEDTLYSDEEDGDPREKIRQIQRKAASQKMAAAKVDSRVGMKPAAKADSRVGMKPAGKDSRTGMKPAAKTSNGRLAATKAKQEEEEVEEDKSKNSGWGDELEAEQEAEQAEAEQAEEEEQEEEEIAPARKPSVRGSQRIQAVSKSGSRRVAAEDDTRRSGRKSMRSGGPKKPLLSKKVIIIGGISVILILAIVIGYDPAMKMWYTKKLDEGASLEERKAAAEALFDRYQDRSLELFIPRVGPGNADLREAAVSGLELVALQGVRARSDAVKTLAQENSKADAAGKAVFLRSLGAITKARVEPKGNRPPEVMTSDANDQITLAAALIPCSEEADMKPELRSLVVDSLSVLAVPGVCKQLIKIAKADKGDLRAKARDGIARTALPDSAGDLLETMTGSDKELSVDAKRAFGRIRTETKSELLLPLVTHDRDDVRREIVEALGMRASDSKAAEGITKALRDKVPEIRELAVKSILKTGISGSASQLAALVTDPEEKVAIANAQTLAQLRDPDSQKVVLESFKNDLKGKVLDAYISALGARSSGKDLKSIGMVMGILESNPGAEASIRPALVMLANRKTNRTNWTVDQWKTWYAKITSREQQRAAAVQIMENDRGKSKVDRSQYASIAKEIENNLDVLEKCKEMCRPDDMEDIQGIDAQLSQYTKIREFFFKGASVDVRN